MTAMEVLKGRLERVERGVLEHSLCSKTLDELLDMQSEITDIREAFLSHPFTGATVDVLEDIRFRILECEFNVHIYVSEAMYQDSTEHMRRLTELYESVS